MQENNTVEAPEISPVSEPKTKNKSLPIIILLAILAVLGIGFGVYGMFFRPAEIAECAETKCEEKGNEEQSSGDQITDSKEAVLAIVSTIETVILNENVGTRPTVITYERGGVTYKNDELKAYTNLDESYGVFTENKSLKDLSAPIIAKLQENGFEDYGFTNMSGVEYINKETGVICEIDYGGGSPYRVECGHISWISEEKIALVNQFAKTNDDDVIYFQLPLNITDSEKSPYQTTTVSGLGHAKLFYRTSPDAEWQFFTGTQAELSCQRYDTEDLKKAYYGTRCYDESTNQYSTVSL